MRNKIGDEGAIALAESFNTNKTLKKIELNDNPITYDGYKALKEAKQKNTRINISFGNIEYNYYFH